MLDRSQHFAKDTTGAEGFVAGAEDWGLVSFVGHCVTHGDTDC